MKRLLLLLPLLILLTFPQLLYAQTATPVPSVSPMSIAVDYTMPYPGLLPDNPLYLLKVFRDRLVSFFISSSLKRSAFDLLQADKRLEAAYYLDQKGTKYEDLVVTTVSKAENYFDEAVQQVEQATSSGEDTSSQIGRLHTAVLKHEELLTAMMSKGSKTYRENLQNQIDRLKGFEKVLNDLSQK